MPAAARPGSVTISARDTPNCLRSKPISSLAPTPNFSGGAPQVKIVSAESSGIDTLAVQLLGRLDDEVLAGGDVAAHQQVEDPLGVLGVLQRDPTQRAVPGVHRRLGQLRGVHLAE